MVLATLELPEQRNAMSPGSVASLSSLLDALTISDACRCIVLAGAGRGFCAGSDLRALAIMTIDERARFERDCGIVTRRIAELRKPVLAAVHGFAVGGGLTLATSCDIVVTSPDVKWSLPEVPIGLFPAWGLQSVERRCGTSAARRLAWGIDMVDGREALRLGLADEMADDPLSVALGLAGKLASLPSEQSAAVKEYFSTRRLGADADAAANELFVLANASPEARATFAKFGS